MDHWQPELGYGPRGFMQTARERDRAQRRQRRLPTSTTRYAAFLLGLADVRRQERAVRGDDDARVAARRSTRRDRWQVNDKLTLDLGLRYEYYPLMHARRPRHRAGRTSSTHSTVQACGGLGGNPKDLGIKVSKTLFAPRLGAVYRINENTVFRTGYGITYNPLPFSRPLRGFYPLTLARGLLRRPTRSAGSTTFEQGIPDVVGPGPELGPHPAAERVPDADAGGTTSRAAASSRGTSSFERRLPCDISVDVAYVGTAKNGGFADIDINASDTPGGGVDEPAVRIDSSAATTRSCSGARSPSRATTRCRSPSTGRSRTACC